MIIKTSSTPNESLRYLQEAMPTGSVPKNKVIYHYCSVEAFYSIMSSKCIWLSAVNNANDYAETTWAESFVNESIARTKTDSNAEQLKSLEDQFQVNSQIPYVASFSGDGDLLSQWRAYTDNAQGVAIGFNLDYFNLTRTMPGGAETTALTIGCAPISYNSDIISRKVDNVILRYLDLENDDGNGLIETALYLRHLCRVSKNPAFREEQEIRILHTPILLEDEKGKISCLGGCSDLKYRIADKKLTSYFELDFSHVEPIHPVQGIILGPKNQFSDYDISLFLKTLDLGAVKFRRSLATYR